MKREKRVHWSWGGGMPVACRQRGKNLLLDEDGDYATCRKCQHIWGNQEIHDC